MTISNWTLIQHHKVRRSYNVCYYFVFLDSRFRTENVESRKTVLEELISRTEDFQNLNALRLLILQHNTFDVDKAAKLIKRGNTTSAVCNNNPHYLYYVIDHFTSNPVWSRRRAGVHGMRRSVAMCNNDTVSIAGMIMPETIKRRNKRAHRSCMPVFYSNKKKNE